MNWFRIVWVYLIYIFCILLLIGFFGGFAVILYLIGVNAWLSVIICLISLALLVFFSHKFTDQNAPELKLYEPSWPSDDDE